MCDWCNRNTDEVKSGCGHTICIKCRYDFTKCVMCTRLAYYTARSNYIDGLMKGRDYA